MTKRKILAAGLAAVLISGAAHAHGRAPASSAPIDSGPQTATASGETAARAPDVRGDVVAEAERWLGARNMTGKGGPWCAHFASYVLQKTGHRPLANGLATSALAYGRRLGEPKVGALAVVTTRVGYAAHVGFVSGVNSDGTIELISGNWGRRVSDSTVPRRSVVAFVDVM